MRSHCLQEFNFTDPYSQVGFLPCGVYRSLNVRGLLDMRSHCLQEFNFTDPYSQVGFLPCML